MTSFTMKNILKQLVCFGNKNKIIWTLHGVSSDKEYTFEVFDKKITLYLRTSMGNHIRLEVPNLETDFFINETFRNISFKIVKYTKDTDKHYKLIDVDINYDAQMFVELFRLLREHVFVEFKVGDTHFYAQYIEGRLCFRDTRQKDIYLFYSGDLYSLHSLFDYEIVKIGIPIKRQGFFKILKANEKLAQDAHLPFKHVPLGKRSEVSAQV